MYCRGLNGRVSSCKICSGSSIHILAFAGLPGMGLPTAWSPEAKGGAIWSCVSFSSSGRSVYVLHVAAAVAPSLILLTCGAGLLKNVVSLPLAGRHPLGRPQCVSAQYM